MWVPVAMTLFRDPRDLDHWYVRGARGWLRFPAGVKGWFAAQIVRHLDETHLRPVPVWLAFNTGVPIKRGRMRNEIKSSNTSEVPAEMSAEKPV